MTKPKPTEKNHKKSKENVVKKKTEKFFKGKSFKKALGSLSEGQGFAALKKKRFLSKFKRKHSKALEDTNNKKFEVQPLASDSSRQAPAPDSINSSVPHQNSSKENTHFTAPTITPEPPTSTNVSSNSDTTTTSNDRKANPTTSTSSSTEKPLKGHDCNKQDKTHHKLGNKLKQKQQKNLKLVEKHKEQEDEQQKKEFQLALVRRQKHEQKVKQNIEKRKKLKRSLSSRTSSGQPVMASQMQHILDKLTKKR